MKEIASLVFLLLSTMLIDCYGESTMKKTSHLLGDKQFYKVSVSAYGLSYLVTVNDVTIHEEYDPEVQVDVDLPVNQYFRSGNNDIAITVYPEDEGGKPATNARLKLELYMTNEASKRRHVLLDLNYSGAINATENSIGEGKYTFENGLKKTVDGEIEIGAVVVDPQADYEGANKFSRTVDIPTSLPLWSFFNSEDIPKIFEWSDEKYYSEIKHLLDDVLRKVENALSTGDIDSVMPLFAERNREIDMAFYLESGTTERNLRESFLESYKDPDLSVSKIGDETWLNFETFPSKKIISLVRGSSDPAVGMQIETGGSRNYPIYFRYENGKWIITR